MVVSGFYFIGFMIIWFLVYHLVDREVVKYVWSGLCLLVSFLFGTYLDKGQEYEVELLNQTTVKVTSLYSGKVYYCAPEKVHEVFEKDNL